MEEVSGRRERKKRATREALVDAAMELVGAQGFDATTIAGIAERAGVSTRTFFLHFPTKEDVLAGGADDRLAIVLREVAERVPGEDPEGALSRAMRQMIDEEPQQMVARRERYRTVLVAVPSMRANLTARRIVATDRVADALCERFPGRIDDIEATALAATVLTALDTAATVTLFAGGTVESIQQAMHRAVDIALSGRRRDG